jgi:hypothetical protein
MGQNTYGILYGAKIAEPSDEDEQERLYDRLHAIGADLVYVDADRPYLLCGFWLAVGASGRDGVPYLVTVGVAEIPTKYREAYDKAVATWPALLAAVRARDELAPMAPGIWFAETEVARCWRLGTRTTRARSPRYSARDGGGDQRLKSCGSS